MSILALVLFFGVGGAASEAVGACRLHAHLNLHSSGRANASLSGHKMAVKKPLDLICMVHVAGQHDCLACMQPVLLCSG